MLICSMLPGYVMIKSCSDVNGLIFWRQDVKKYGQVLRINEKLWGIF